MGCTCAGWWDAHHQRLLQRQPQHCQPLVSLGFCWAAQGHQLQEAQASKEASEEERNKVEAGEVGFVLCASDLSAFMNLAGGQMRTNTTTDTHGARACTTQTKQG